jgi:hypothetical protein
MRGRSSIVCAEPDFYVIRTAYVDGPGAKTKHVHERRAPRQARGHSTRFIDKKHRHVAYTLPQAMSKRSASNGNRTSDKRLMRPLPCHLATPQYEKDGAPSRCCPELAEFWRLCCAAGARRVEKMERSAGIAPASLGWPPGILLLDDDRGGEGKEWWSSGVAGNPLLRYSITPSLRAARALVGRAAL